MKILVISDIHANLMALKAVLDAAGEVDAVWCLGDVVGYGPNPNECVELIRKQPNVICLLGNHDAACIGKMSVETFNHEARMAVDWTKSILTLENRDFLLGLPETVVHNEVTLAHGSPREPVYEYLLDVQSAAENFAAWIARRHSGHANRAGGTAQHASLRAARRTPLKHDR